MACEQKYHHRHHHLLLHDPHPRVTSTVFSSHSFHEIKPEKWLEQRLEMEDQKTEGEDDLLGISSSGSVTKIGLKGLQWIVCSFWNSSSSSFFFLPSLWIWERRGEGWQQQRQLFALIPFGQQISAEEYHSQIHIRDGPEDHSWGGGDDGSFSSKVFFSFQMVTMWFTIRRFRRESREILERTSF